MYRVFFLMFFLTISAKVCSSTNVEWGFNNDGSELSYVITSIQVSSLDDVLFCGNSGSYCSMEMQCGRTTVYREEIMYTWGQRYMRLSKILDNYTRYHLPKSGVIKTCVDSFLGIHLIVLDSNSPRKYVFVASTKDGSMNPPPPVLPPVSCSIGGDINLAHGVLNQDNVNGNTKSVYAQVSCNREATVKITARANNGGDVVTLRSDGSLKSKLQVNNIAGATGTTVQVPGGNGVSVLFSSTLSSNSNVSAGNFAATAIALLEIQ